MIPPPAPKTFAPSQKSVYVKETRGTRGDLQGTRGAPQVIGVVPRVLGVVHSPITDQGMASNGPSGTLAAER